MMYASIGEHDIQAFVVQKLIGYIMQRAEYTVNPLR